MRIANYHKSSNDFDTAANKMNKKLKAKPLEHNAAAIITRMVAAWWWQGRVR